MAIASTPTKLPLAEFARIAGFHPLHFEQVEFTPEGRTPSVCEAPVLQHGWQSRDRVSREDIAQALADAESMLERYLGWHLTPTWDADEWQNTPRPYRPELFGSRFDVRGHSPSVVAKWRKVISGGVEAKTLIEAASSVSWVEDVATGVRTGTTTTMVALGMPSCELELYHPGHSGEASYQIRPVHASVVGSVATLTFRRELAVKEALLNTLNPEAVDYEDDAMFLSTVDIYRHYNDPSTQVTLMWEPGSGCGSCNGSGCQLCSYSAQSGCLFLRSTPDVGVLGWTPGVWNNDTLSFDSTDVGQPGAPDIARLYYYSGLRPSSGCPQVMSPEWARTVTYLALAGLERPICDCTADVWEYWREDLALLSGGEQFKTYAFTLREEAGNNPFGTRRGALNAWRRVVDPNVASGHSATLIG